MRLPLGKRQLSEAVEICKLRLFLKLVSQLQAGQVPEPLPEIDFNSRAGNTLVGYTRLSKVGRGQANLYLEEQRATIEDKAKVLDTALFEFRLQQTRLNGAVTQEDKQSVRTRLADLETELNAFLAAEYGLRKTGMTAWRRTHKPFHWFSEFHRIIADGGFDVVIGNPPYVEYRKVRTEYQVQEDHFKSVQAANLYAFCRERSLRLLKNSTRFGMIVHLHFRKLLRVRSYCPVLLPAKKGCPVVQHTEGEGGRKRGFSVIALQLSVDPTQSKARH